MAVPASIAARETGAAVDAMNANRSLFLFAHRVLRRGLSDIAQTLYEARPMGAPIIFWLICAGVVTNLILAGLGIAP